MGVRIGTSDNVKGSTSLVKCLEAEGVRHVFGIPGEENLDLMDSLIDSDIEFVLTRHESSAAFMAGMIGRLTRRPGACLTTLGPGASNMVIGVAEAYLSYDPMVAMSGQVRRGCPVPRKQYIDLVSMFRPITKDSFSMPSAERMPELTRRAFDVAAEERPGPVFMELPEDVLKERTGAMPLPFAEQERNRAVPDMGALRTLLASAERPLVLAGAGVLRAGAVGALREFVSAWNMPAAMTWMGAGAVAFDDKLSLNTVGLRRSDIVHTAFEDADLIVVNKPRGMVVHPAPGHEDGTLVNALLAHCGESLSGVGGERRPGIVHRIDKDTSGLLVAAKNDFAHLALSAQLADHTMARTYEAVVCGNLREDAGTVDAPIGRHPTDRKRMAVTQKNARRAVTHWSVIARYNGYTHIRCELETGRTHQIRVHMAHIGHPLLGDLVYGHKRPEKGLSGQCLHARALRFIHPRTGELVTCTCPLPEYFQDVLARLGTPIG